MAVQYLETASAPSFGKRVPLDATSVPANSVQKETFTVQGIRGRRAVFVNKPTDETGLVILHSRATADDTVEITFWNYTGSPIDPASQDYYIYQP